MKVIPAKLDRYFEPFAGGAALFFAVEQRAERAVLNDSNPDLIGMYISVASRTGKVIAALERHQKEHGQKHYYEMRQRWNEEGHWTEAERAAAFIYLNKTCFNGLWRVNRAGSPDRRSPARRSGPWAR